jgi:flavin-binding protein dodecin
LVEADGPNTARASPGCDGFAEGQPANRLSSAHLGFGSGAVHDHVYKVIEIVGSSNESIESAIKNAIGRANQTLRGLDWFEVREIRGSIHDGAVGRFQVKLGIGFRLMDERELGDD